MNVSNKYQDINKFPHDKPKNSKEAKIAHYGYTQTLSVKIPIVMHVVTCVRRDLH